MIEKIYMLIEIISILLMLWALHGSRKRPGIYTIAYICIVLIIETAVLEEWISANYYIFIHLLLVLLNMLEFKENLKRSILYVLLNDLVLFAVEYILGILFLVVTDKKFLDPKSTFLVMILLFIIVFGIYRKGKLNKLCGILLNNNIISNSLIILIGISCIIYATQFKHGMEYDRGKMVYVAVVFLVVFSLIFEWQREKYQSRQKEAELEIFRRYDAVYRDLILSMRRKQHDFDNHIQAVYSMSMTEDGLEELIQRKNEYCQKLLEENQDSIFLREDVNPVFLGFLYTEKKRPRKWI